MRLVVLVQACFLAAASTSWNEERYFESQLMNFENCIPKRVTASAYILHVYLPEEFPATQVSETDQISLMRDCRGMSSIASIPVHVRKRVVAAWLAKAYITDYVFSTLSSNIERHPDVMKAALYLQRCKDSGMSVADIIDILKQEYISQPSEGCQPFFTMAQAQNDAHSFGVQVIAKFMDLAITRPMRPSV